jgi:hypothetical protein
MRRREFLRGLAAAQMGLIAAQVGCSKHEAGSASIGQTPPSATHQLNVVVHGMFAIIVDKVSKPNKVVLKAPNVPSHVYKAMTFSVNPTDPQDLIPGWTYQAKALSSDAVQFDRGPESTLDVRIGEADRLAVYVHKPGKKAPFWTIDLPLPDNICGLRASPVNYLSPCGTGKCSTYNDHTVDATYVDNEMFVDQHCPTAYVLTYQRIPAKTVAFTGNNQIVDLSRVGRLHFFAEPDTIPTPSTSLGGAHVDDAITELNKLFDPQLTLRFWTDRPGKDFEVARDGAVTCNADYSILLCEERSLYELTESCSDFLKTQTIDTQYSQYLESLQLEARLQSKVNKTAGQKALRPKYSRQSLGKKLSLLPSNGKPPSNCMSLLGIQA